MDLRQRFENLRLLRKAIQWDEEKIAAIESSLGAATQRITGMPVVHSNTDHMVDRLIEMAELKDQVEFEKLAMVREERFLFDFVSHVEDKEVSLLLRLRFFDDLTWTAIAWKMGKSYTADSCRMVVSRFFSGEAGE